LIVAEGNLRDGFGWNLVASTAFGIVYIKVGLRFVRKTRFSLQVLETHIAQSMSVSVVFKIAFI
jgi:hypothetical protein